MAKFKVGDKVRVKQNARPARTRGLEGTILRPGEAFSWIVSLPLEAYAYAGLNHLASDTVRSPNDWPMDECELEPAVDPKADAFLESIRKLKPLDERVYEIDGVVWTVTPADAGLR